jgi:imidazolonepropionase-like amidohydrolase
MKKIYSLLFLAFLVLYSERLWAQFGLPQADLSNERPNEFALTNITLISAPGQKTEKASLYVKDGKIMAAGLGIVLPANVKTFDLKGAWIYPSFIEINSKYGLPVPGPNPAEPFKRGEMAPQYESRRAGPYLWNEALKPEFDASGVFAPNPKEAEEWRKNGFAYAVTTSKNGIMRGTGFVCHLGQDELSKLILKNSVLQGMSFQKGSSTQQYPSSQMGAIALLRQTFLDAEWYQKSSKKTVNLGLEALNKNKSLPILFETQQKYEVLRAGKLAKEFGLSLIIKGKGDEYQRMDEIKALGFPLVLSLQFPELPDVEDPMDAELVNLADMKHWELAPFNAGILASKGINFALSASDLKDGKAFFANLRKLIDNGLSKETALAALTTVPAGLLKMDGQIGQIKPGMAASFFSASGDIFSSGTILGDHWVMGKKYAGNPIFPAQVKGTYQLKIGADSSFRLKIDSKEMKTEFVISGTDTIKNVFQGQYSNGKINFLGLIKKTDSLNRFQFSGWETDFGFSGFVSGGKWEGQKWTAKKLPQTDITPKPDSLKKLKKDNPGEIWFPFQAYGNKNLPLAQDFVITNATVWTCEAEGKLENTDVWISGGKIKKIGKTLPVPPNAVKVDGTGKHLSPGIVDEHSHIAISKGVNEGSSTTSSEVRIGDVVEADDINIYRHLAGGVTSVQQLHGSANSIGGQSSLVKMRWGKSPEEMKIDGAVGFIKFALGENVKQSNWGDAYSVRYPQTRMGVEQLFYDAFHQAKKYQKERALAAKNPKPEFRKDLKLEALAEILEKKRFISCHSYVQSEINMLMHVGDSMGFTVNTFTHILEGYKVADKMKKHGAGASTFSDWWAYKMEVKDAIPYNAALLHKAGVTVAINSDDAEMARRLNQEAAKTIKYGGVSPEEALKMVTLNPAKLLHLDNRLGSIKEGKDADLVLWSADPLSMLASVEKTFVDGILYFDLEEARKKEQQNRLEKQRIVQKMILAKQTGAPTFAPQPKVQHLWHCDDEGEE